MTATTDPYGDYRFRVKWDGRYVAGFSRVSGLTHATQVIAPVTPRPLPGQSAHEAVVLERGVTQDQVFAQWANMIWDYDPTTDNGAGDPNETLAAFRKDVVVELWNESGQMVLAYTVHRCWPSEFTAFNVGDELAVQSLKLENEGWERDPPA